MKAKIQKWGNSLALRIPKSFALVLPEGLKVTGAVLSDQVENLDWKARQAKLVCRVPQTATNEALNKLSALLRI
jgi:mRNA interferase MazF